MLVKNPQLFLKLAFLRVQYVQESNARRWHSNYGTAQQQPCVSTQQQPCVSTQARYDSRSRAVDFRSDANVLRMSILATRKCVPQTSPYSCTIGPSSTGILLMFLNICIGKTKPQTTSLYMCWRVLVVAMVAQTKVNDHKRLYFSRCYTAAYFSS